ncbi:MAG TPA: NRDE family protein, partial [Burkholderiaceae bacterium]|nr:NRDE family protein [Burkholderiaceae bacterium]
CAPGFGALSNADFDTPWPKLTRLKNGLAELVGNGLATDAALLALLRDETIPPDALLPQTGITLERERVLSCAFVAGSDYGTRASSLVRLGRAQADFTETCFHANDMRATRRVVWPLVPAKPPARMSLRSRPLQAPMD